MKHELLSKSRFEAFTDGVFAIAITLLVLEIHVPDFPHGDNAAMSAWIAHLWPSVFTYVLSFMTVGIIWVNHHETYYHMRYVDRTMNLLNLLLLLTVCFVPYPTALLAKYGALPASTAFYGAVFCLMGICYGAVWQYAASLQHRIDESTPALTWGVRLRGSIGTLFYLLGAILAFLKPNVSVAMYVAVTMYYALPRLFHVRHTETESQA